MKIFGHPLHLMLIHFPSALFPMDVVCSLMGRMHSLFLYASVCAMCGGVLLGWLAVITGTFDLTSVVKNKPASVKKALMHGGINTVVLTGYTLLACMALKKYPMVEPDHVAVLIFKVSLVIFMIVGNYIGGSLVLKDKVLDEK